MEVNLRKARFTIETFPGEVFDGYTDGEEWNGWAVPYFDVEQARQIAKIHEKSLSIKSGYDESTDEFIFAFPGNPERYPSVLMQHKKLYPVGSSVWIWEEIDDAPQ